MARLQDSYALLPDDALAALVNLTIGLGIRGMLAVSQSTA
jgi:hypothetical protein